MRSYLTVVVFFYGGGGGSNFLRTQNSFFSTKLSFGGPKIRGAPPEIRRGSSPQSTPPPHSYATCLGYCAPPPLPPSCFSIPGSVSKEYMIFNSRTSKSKPCVVHTNVTSKGGGAHMSSSKHPPNSPVIKVHVLCNMNECLKMR